ncbi:MAG: hypothetical protein LBO72_07590 [Helicobacteraceae bacterium]|nr:hypothetical protein [Helicobacteraceae bacterium]
MILASIVSDGDRAFIFVCNGIFAGKRASRAIAAIVILAICCAIPAKAKI